LVVEQTFSLIKHYYNLIKINAAIIISYYFTKIVITVIINEGLVAIIIED
jgi:hypothetical protein